MALTSILPPYKAEKPSLRDDPAVSAVEALAEKLRQYENAERILSERYQLLSEKYQALFDRYKFSSEKYADLETVSETIADRFAPMSDFITAQTTGMSDLRSSINELMGLVSGIKIPEPVVSSDVGNQGNQDSLLYEIQKMFSDSKKDMTSIRAAVGALVANKPVRVPVEKVTQTQKELEVDVVSRDGSGGIKRFVIRPKT